MQWLLLAMLMTAACPAWSQQGAARPALVFAAASLTDVLQRIGADYARERGGLVQFSFASTATLARQLEAGAGADLFFAADQEWLDYVDQRGLIVRASRTNLLGNRLVLVEPASQSTALPIRRGLALRKALGPAGRLAIADPASVPAGKYARAALTTLGVWGEIEPRLAMAENVRAALAFVARGEAPFGIVYATDAKSEARVRVVGEFPSGTHPPIIYPVALTTQGSADAARFLDYLRGDAARAQFVAAGFQVLRPTAGAAAAPGVRR